ncbi:hypothetical protein [Pueribacillus sp. YX66]|uniref:hypothetical protein n=1 Tax=Pueribacillus sp. YX66 TaxID=3229242 RepID=UPI00358D9444
MKNIMKRAWEIARKGQEKFGGKVSEYFAEALKMAWAETKKVTITTTSGSKRNKSWVAKITGTHPKWKLNREFVDAVEENDWTGKVFELESGIYEVCDAGDREFIKIDNGEIEYLEYEEVTAMVA